MIPLWFTWLLLSFLFRTLSGIGNPIVKFCADRLSPIFPALADLLNVGVFQSIVAVILVLAVLYSLGVLARMVIGRRIIIFFEQMIEQIPFVKTIYGAVKKLLIVLQDKPGSDVQRVVLINFPSEEMKTVGLVTRTFNGRRHRPCTGSGLRPDDPEPHLRIPRGRPGRQADFHRLGSGQAMTFIVSGGAIAPDKIYYDQSAPPPARDDDEDD